MGCLEKHTTTSTINNNKAEIKDNYRLGRVQRLNGYTGYPEEKTEFRIGSSILMFSVSPTELAELKCSP